MLKLHSSQCDLNAVSLNSCTDEIVLIWQCISISFNHSGYFDGTAAC